MGIIVACGEVTDAECAYLSDAMAKRKLDPQIVRVRQPAYESGMFTGPEHDIRSEMNDEDSASWLWERERELASMIFTDGNSMAKVKAFILPITPERGHPHGKPFTWLIELFPENTALYEVCAANELGCPTWLKSIGNNNFGNALPPTSHILF